MPDMKHVKARHLQNLCFDGNIDIYVRWKEIKLIEHFIHKIYNPNQRLRKHFAHLKIWMWITRLSTAWSFNWLIVNELGSALLFLLISIQIFHSALPEYLISRLSVSSCSCISPSLTCLAIASEEKKLIICSIKYDNLFV